MNDLHDRFRSLDDLSTPDLWREVEARAEAMPQRSGRTLPWALVAVMLLLLALAIGGAALIGSGVVKLPSAPSLVRSPSPSPTATPITGPIVGTWAAGETTCAQQLAAIQAAGFSKRQMTRVGVDPTCANGLVIEGSGFTLGSQFTLTFDPSGSLRTFEDGVFDFNSPLKFRLGDGSTFEANGPGSLRRDCMTYQYAIDGDQLTIEIIDPGCPTTGEAPLQDQIALTVLFETSPFTRQP
jgi:hypothetical protein